MKDKLLQAMENFIAERINHIGGSDSAVLAKANEQVEIAAEKLTASLTPEQTKLWNEYELAASILEGETKTEYYKNGVRDSVLLVLRAIAGGADDEN